MYNANVNDIRLLSNSIVAHNNIIVQAAYIYTTDGSWTKVYGHTQIFLFSRCAYL